MLNGRSYDDNLEGLERAMGVAQHHDAVTGTAQQHVTDDYVLRLDVAMKNLQNASLPKWVPTFFCSKSICLRSVPPFKFHSTSIYWMHLQAATT